MRKLTALGLGALLLCTGLVWATDVLPAQKAKSADEAAQLNALMPAADAANQAGLAAPQKPDVVERDGEVEPGAINKQVPSGLFADEQGVSNGTRGLTCPPDALFGQNSHSPSDGWSAGTSDASFAEQYKVYDNFSAVSGDICQVHFWGLTLSWNSGWSACMTENPMDFLIEFWPDQAGQPGATAIAQYTVGITGVPTGQSYSGYESTEYVGDLVPCVTGVPSGWVSIQGVSIGFPTNCVFLWMSGFGADSLSYQWNGTQLAATTYDRALCLQGIYIPTYGACCLDDLPQCTENVELLACLAQGGRFGANILCADLQPPCGQIPGACCDQGTCVGTMTQTACLTAYPAGQWFEWEDCATFVCPAVNDECESAIAIGDVVDLPWDNSLATTSNIGTHTINKDIFYCYTASCTGIASFDLCGSTFDTKIAVWNDCACPPTQELAYNDDSGPICSGVQSSVQVPVVAGQRYLVQVGAYSTYYGLGDLTIQCVVPPVGACCHDTVCTQTFQLDCTSSGGIYMGDNVPCDPNPCLGLCCTINVNAYPYVDDVETGFGDWLNAVVGDQMNWTWYSGATPSSSTGPDFDHTFGTTAGHYFYTEASGYTSKLAILDGPCYDVSSLTTPGVVFWYHMYGSTMGTLTLEASDDMCNTWVPVWTLSGDQGNQWRMAQVDLSAFTGSIISLRFKGLTGSNYYSDMALDDIWVGDVGAVTGACCVGTVCTIEEEDYCLTTLGGYYLGDFTNCDGNPCSGACCVMFDCIDTLNEPACLAAGGTEWTQGATCPTYACNPYCDICFTESGDPDDWITLVRFGFIDNPTGPENPVCWYGDYSYLQTPVAPGATYTLEVHLGVNGSWTQCVTAFFDWNRDGVYDNTTERYDLGCQPCTVGGANTYMLDITVPSGASYGLSGMRVVEQYSSAVVDACTGATYGETEDYRVDIQPTPAACCYPNGTCDTQLPDDCALLGGVYGGALSVCAGTDCDSNGVDDFCDVLGGAYDCNNNLIPDVCELPGHDCNTNGILDECDVAFGTSPDCNENLIPDECDVASGASIDCNNNGIPDECEDDCNGNGVADSCEVPIACGGTCDPANPPPWGCAQDCQCDGIPDDCQLGRGARDDMVIHITARGQNNPTGHFVSLLDQTGTKFGQYDEIAAAQSSSWGYRDGTFDGDYVYFGWESGVARHDANGANGVQVISGAPPGGPSVWRALAYDPTNLHGEPGFWTADWASNLVKVSMTGTMLVSLPSGGYSLYGLAFDPATGKLWGHGMPGDINIMVEIDPVTGAMTGVQWSTDYTGQGGTQGGLDICGDYLFGVSQETPDVVFSCDKTGALAGPITPNPRGLDDQTGENGNLGIAVVCPPQGADCNGNSIPDECEIPIALGGYCDPAVTTCAEDCNGDMVPDECQLGENDCNNNNIPDDCDIATGTSLDCQPNGIPDECEIIHNDCNTNGIPDDCDLQYGTSQDCNTNGVPDECDIAGGFSADCQPDGIPDECQLYTALRDVILSEGFEAAFPPASWTAIATHTGQMTWFQGTSPYVGTYAAQCDWDPALVPQDEWLLTPPLMLFGNVTLSGATMGSVYWGVTPYDNYDVEAWIVFGPAPDPFTDILIAQLDQNHWITNWTYETFMYQFAAPGIPFRLGFRYVGTDGAQGNIDEILVEGETGAPPNDCNMNGVPDECDIPPICSAGWPTCSLDSNGNEIPDECEAVCLGDSNCDGEINWRDVDFFVAALGGQGVGSPGVWAAMFPGTPTCTFLNNDVNGDGLVNWRDIEPFIQLMDTMCP